MNVSIPPVFAEVILGDPNTWVAHCEECHTTLSDPVVDRESLKDVIEEHSSTHQK